MDTRKEVLESLKKEFELDKDVSFGSYVTYVTSIDDLAYMPDEEVKWLIDENVSLFMGRQYGKIVPGSCNWELYTDRFHQLTREKEQIAYERYKTIVKDKIFFQLEEMLYFHDFLERFTDGYHNHQYLKYEQGIMAINHNSNFYDVIPYRYVPMYVCARKGNDYTFIETNSLKIPDAYELFTFVSSGYCLHYCFTNGMRQESVDVEADEWFALVFNTEGNCRATSYYKWVHFGMAVRPDKKEVEFYDANQAIRIFHELFGKCKKFFDHAFGEYDGEAKMKSADRDRRFK